MLFNDSQVVSSAHLTKGSQGDTFEADVGRDACSTNGAKAFTGIALCSNGDRSHADGNIAPFIPDDVC